MNISISLFIAAAVVSILSVWITTKKAELTNKVITINMILTATALAILILSIIQLNAQENEKLRDVTQAELDRSQAASDRAQAALEKQHQHEIDSITFSRVDTSFQLALGMAGWSRVMNSSMEIVKLKSDKFFEDVQESFMDNIARQEQLMHETRRMQFPLDDGINISFKFNFEYAGDSILKQQGVTNQTDLLHPTPMDTFFIHGLANITDSLEAVSGNWVLLISFFEPGVDSACLQLSSNINPIYLATGGSASLYYNNPAFELHFRNIPCTIVWNKATSSLLDLSNKAVRLTVKHINQKYAFKRTITTMGNVRTHTHSGSVATHTSSYMGYIRDFSIGTRKLRSYDYKPLAADTVNYIPEIRFPAL